MNVLLTIFLILGTTAMHGGVTAALLTLTAPLRERLESGQAALLRAFFVPLVVLVLVAVAVAEAAVWAVYYVVAGYLSSMSEALYFSLVTMTTLGYGDVTLVREGRLIAGIQAALGIVLFGWTTALIFSAVETVHGRRGAMETEAHK